jgi:indole-3-acetate monooxygenase
LAAGLSNQPPTKFEPASEQTLFALHGLRPLEHSDGGKLMTTTSSAEMKAFDAVDKIRPILEKYRDEAERERSLPAAVVTAMREVGLLKLWVPKEYGGDEVDLPVFMKVAEAMARIDSAAGWVQSVGAAGPLLTAFVPATNAMEVYAHGPDGFLAGASAPQGARAVAVDGGYKVSGRWPLASGCQHGEWLGIVTMVFDEDAPVIDEHGAPDFKSMFLPRQDCQIEDTWYSLGMRGTGSTHFSVNDAFVPEGRVFSVFTAQPQVSGPLYKLGVLPMFAMTTTSVLPGIARAAIDEFVALAKAKTPTFSQTGLATRPTIHAEVARVEALVQSARAYLYEVAEEMMASVKAGQAVSEDLEARRRLACANVGASCIQAVDRLFALAGSTSVYSGNRLEKLLRDIHTAGQHLFVSPVWWEKTGQYYFGLGLGMP